MNHNILSSTPGSRKERMRVGRGKGSGKGTFSGRGCKGQGSRTGRGKFNAAFEGGQTPLVRRLPKARGFTAYNPTEYAVINLSTLSALFAKGMTDINLDSLKNAGVVRSSSERVKLLGQGEITGSGSVSVQAASASAQAALASAGITLTIA
jgi:large subunit ribosomal protein L15